MGRIDETFADVQHALDQHQPQLKAEMRPDHIHIQGVFVCVSDAGPFDQYEVEIAISALFPEKEPFLWETGGRIPRTMERHVFPRSGRACLGLWEAWLLRNTDASFERYLCSHVTSYFVSQSIFELTGEWPFGEQGHGREDIARTYAEALHLPTGWDYQSFVRLLGGPRLEGNATCPCGSGRRLKHCHWQYIRDVRRVTPAYIRRDMRERLDKSTKE
jgi:hypothetical protein